jgi:hypothetical protein
VVFLLLLVWCNAAQRAIASLCRMRIVMPIGRACGGGCDGGGGAGWGAPDKPGHDEWGRGMTKGGAA